MSSMFILRNQVFKLNVINHCALVYFRIIRITTIGIVEDVSEFIKEVCSCVGDQVKNCLRQNGIDTLSVSALSDIFTSSNETVVPFNQLMTHHQQLAYYRKHYNLIVSIIFLSVDIFILR